MPDFADALNHFRATVKPLSTDEQRIVEITGAEFDRLFGAEKAAIVTESPSCAAHAKPLGRRAEIAKTLADAAGIVNKAASS